MRAFLRATAVVAAAVLSEGAASCDYCLISQGISPLDTVTGRGLRVSQRYTLLDSVYDGADEIANPGAKEEYFTTELAGFWSPANWLTVIGVVPLRVTHVDGHLEHRGGAHGHDEEEEEHDDDDDDDDHAGADSRPVEDQHGGDEGLGDFSLLARARVLQLHSLAATSTVALLAGVKAPTGNTDGHADGGEFLDAHLQLGTGSTDGLVGVSASHVRGRWSLAANMLGAVKGEGEAGNVDYEYGDSINYDLTGRYRLRPAVIGAAARQTFLSFGVAGEIRGREEEDGIEIEDSGGHVLFVQPGLQLNAGSRWTFEISAQVPVHHDLTGIQLGDDFKVLASVTLLL